MTDMQHWFQQALMKWFTYNEPRTSTYVLYVEKWKNEPQSKPLKKLCVENHYLPPEMDNYIRINFEERLPELIRILNEVRSPTVFTPEEKQFLKRYIITHKYKKKSTREILSFMYGPSNGVISHQKILKEKTVIDNELHHLQNYKFSLVINKTDMGFILSDEPFTPIPIQLFTSVSKPEIIDRFKELKVEDIILYIFDSIKSDIESGNLAWLHNLTYNWILTPELMLVLNEKTKKDTIDITDPSAIIGINYINFASSARFCISKNMENFNPVKRLLAFNESQGDNLLEIRTKIDNQLKQLKNDPTISNSEQEPSQESLRLLGSEYGMQETIELLQTMIKKIEKQLEYGYLISKKTRENLKVTLNFLKVLREGAISLFISNVKYLSDEERKQKKRVLFLQLILEWDHFHKSLQ